MSVGPTIRSPIFRFPRPGPEAQQKGVAARAVELAQWWTKFNDPLLDSLVERAAKSNPGPAFGRSPYTRGSGIASRDRCSGAWPTLDVSGSYTRNRASENAIAAPGQGAVIAPSGGGANLDQNLYRTGFDATWEIDVFGRVRRSVEAADATIEVTVEDRRDVLVTLLGEVARNYIDLRGVQRQLAVARANLKTQQDTLELTQVRFQAGLASDLDVAQQEAQVNTTAS